MFCFIKLLIATTAIIQLVYGQQVSPLEYVNIAVGEGGLYFVHPEGPAGIGDVIIFSFAGPGPMNHSVIQGTYDNPCHPLPGGFYSGFVPVAAGEQDDPRLFLVTVNSTDPIYFYCGQIGHCQAGMVGVINPPCDGNGINSSGSFQLYQSAAKLVTSVGPLPSAIWGGQFVSTYPTGTPKGPAGPSYSGFSASCTSKSNSSSNSTVSTTTSVVTSPSVSSTPLVSSSGGKSIYGDVSFKHQKLPSFIWQAGSWIGLISAALFMFIII